ncbi:outer spore coat protein CotE [Paenibacillus vulneris]|uniref:Outer spore coat protein CotE n=1 Tax=Paenibacillus vulneris TaxID=1133364 RepID=A0ABW3UUI9_9BACL|nr:MULTISPECIES: outer spore coat protein CotE [unclassified Paenibacillus]MBE1441784.1 spore coat protein E [Paenibacillus sp. OAS669]
MSIDKDLHYREIYTKAVCGKGRKFSQVTNTVTPPHAPTSILGAWIINNQYDAVKSGDHVEVVGTYDINIWYSYDKNTKTDVAKETISYVEAVGLSYLDKKHRPSTAEVTAMATQEPNCVEASISSSGDSVIIRVEREFKVEMIAETKIWVVVNPHGSDDYEDKAVDFDDAEDGDFEDLDPDFLDDDLN